jgi:serine/threonine-protein kinase
MNRWPEVEPLVDQLLELSGEEGEGFLAGCCAGDAELREQVERFMAGIRAAEKDFLAEPAAVYGSIIMSARHSLEPGTVLGGYLIRKKVGRGGMATVYLARDTRHERDVALKVLHHEIAIALGPDRFRREIKVTAGLRHSNILPLFDSGSEQDTLFYVMPYVVGETLRDRLTREIQLPVGDAVRLVQDIAEALEHAHRHGVIHRDIKPENILLQEGHALIADFGVALVTGLGDAERLTVPGGLVGTPAYMSPEQAAGDRDLGPPADIYALGCVLYEMLGGEPPFTGGTPQQVLARHAIDPVPALHIVCPAVPAHVERAIMRALAKRPADRFGSAKEFTDGLMSAFTID